MICYLGVGGGGQKLGTVGTDDNGCTGGIVYCSFEGSEYRKSIKYN